MYIVCTWFLYTSLVQLCVFSRNMHNANFLYDRDLPAHISGVYRLPVLGPLHGGGVSSSPHHTAAAPTLPSSNPDPSVQIEFFTSFYIFLGHPVCLSPSLTSISPRKERCLAQSSSSAPHCVCWLSWGFSQAWGHATVYFWGDLLIQSSCTDFLISFYHCPRPPGERALCLTYCSTASLPT